MEPRLFFRLSKKNNVILVFFKMHKTIFFLKNNKKIVCLPYLHFSGPLLERHIFLHLALKRAAAEDTGFRGGGVLNIFTSPIFAPVSAVAETKCLALVEAS